MSIIPLLRQQRHARAPVVDDYHPLVVERWPDQAETWRFTAMPRGVVLHGSRSPTDKDREREFWDTLNNWIPVTQYAFNVLIGEDKVGIVLPAEMTGHHAFSASGLYLSCEFAQSAFADQTITDGQVRAFCWWWTNKVLPVWPRISLHMPTHAEVEHSGETVRRSGKTDVHPYGSPLADQLRARILARLR